MAKKNRNKDDLPEGMSRRQAKLARRAAERAEALGEPRPFEGFAAEPQLIALQEFVPAATAEVDLKGIDRRVTLATVLPGAGAAMVREENGQPHALVALQLVQRSRTPARDLAAAITWAATAEAGSALTGADLAGLPAAPLADVLPVDATLRITPREDFSWWFPDGEDVAPQLAQGLQRANETVVPSVPVGEDRADVPGAAWWVNPGHGKGHIRWVRTEEEPALLAALARLAAAEQLTVGEGSRFAGVFRTHGVAVPVFDVDPECDPASYGDELAALNRRIEEALADESPLPAAARRQLENIKSRQVTLR